MEQILTGNIWNQIAPKVRQEARRLAAIAYVSDASFLRLSKNDVLVCDASDSAIKSRGTSAKALQTFLDAGVLLYNDPNLHAKVVVFGHYALIGSCNLSAWSATRLREAAVLSLRPTVRSQAMAFIHAARDRAMQIDQSFIDRVSNIKLGKPAFVPRPMRQTETELGSRSWVISSWPLRDSSHTDERDIVAQGERKAESLLTGDNTEVDSIRWYGKSRFRKLAKSGDTLLEIHHPSKSRTEVYQPTPVLLRQDTTKWTRIYYEVPSDHPYMPWSQFEKELRHVGITSITKNSTKELSARERALLDTMWARS